MTRRTIVCLVLTTVGCTPPPEPDGPYEGSCPILIECTAQRSNDPVLEASNLAAYGEDGSCWNSGHYHWQACRDSCVAAIDSLNEASLAIGLSSCGTCERNSDCAGFEAASCVDGYCARKRLGDIGDDDSGDAAETDTDTETGGSGDDCLSDDTPDVVLDTSLGVMRLGLDSVAAPEATQVFLQHVSADYYDNSIIHRVVEGVLIQGGSYGPGPTLLSSEIAPVELLTPSTLAHEPGVIALLPSADGTRVGPQFYMTVGPTSPSAMASGVVFGALIDADGTEVLDAISSVPVTTVAWSGFQLTNIPEQDVVVYEAYCVAQ
ncbi:peptidylprolyl isomerase [Enhygromyxa salina]|uniref:peptidylprolyl isomerase n=1 Tax=Enhygromyxa salina TaxID=215803 RepID=UPI0011B1D268|nr:peptidylprolyl isomerase [Enhygromyxa salina]